MPRTRPESTQMNLFHPPRKRPAWTSLPEKVRNGAVRLLARMLRERWTRQGSKVRKTRELSHE